jgi:Icc-related predicted phosphoesterase
MRLCFFSDTHGHHRNVKIPPSDILICGGDFSPNGKLRDVVDFIDWFERQVSDYKILIAGNHDISFDGSKFSNDQKPDWLQDLLNSYTAYPFNFYLENTGIEIKSIKFWGSPVTPDFYPQTWAFNKPRGEEIAEVWKQIPDNTDVVITHGPPIGFGDFIPSQNTKVGCTDLYNRLIEVKPKIHCFGHIHEGNSIIDDPITGIKFCNGAICDEYYDPINKPHIIEII